MTSYTMRDFALGTGSHVTAPNNGLVTLYDIILRTVVAFKAAAIDWLYVFGQTSR